VALIGWTLLHGSDYALTLWTARLLQGRAGDTIHFEGGVELTPQFRTDIARLRLVSPRFLLALTLMLAYLVATWVIAGQLQTPEVYRAVAGGLLLLELVIHLRHVRNRYSSSTSNGAGSRRAGSPTRAGSCFGPHPSSS